MNSNNETCIQRLIFIFNFESLSSISNNKRSFPTSILAQEIEPHNIRSWKEYLNLRLERIAQMMEILTEVHKDWSITERKNYFQMETISFNLEQAQESLKIHGFDKKDYVLNIEYTRKWGVL